jgi:DNA-binding NarL/FixJ family response regulator
MTPLRIVLADDHPIVREGLKSLVDADDEMRVVGEAGDGEAAYERVRELHPDVLVMDLSMPRLSGVRVAERVSAEWPAVKVLALSVHEERGYVTRALQAGASGYVLKRAAADELVRAIRVVAGGGVYLDPLIAGKVIGPRQADRPAAPRARRRPRLSARELEVVRRIARGFSNKEIATELGLSVKTVETYKARSMEKLGLASRVEIVRFAVRNGWLTGE